MILVTGAAGQLGRLVIEYLLARVPAPQIIAAVRHPEKVADLAARGVVVRVADYDKPEHWPSVLQGVEKVLLISGPEVGIRVRQHQAVIEAVAASESVRLLAYTSMLRADMSKIPYASEDRETERLVRETGVPHAFLRHGWYTENYTMNAGYAVQEGKFYGCAKNGRISGASRADYAEAAATVLTAIGQLKSVYELAGSTSFTLYEVAAEISRQSGRPVEYIDLSEPDYQALLENYGLPSGLSKTLALADTGAAVGDVYSESDDLTVLIGRPTKSLATVVENSLKNEAIKE
ncbi:SDR family oxidoreductase [Burkholderia sp. LMG 13014]|uniref:SDR family oxidoreductase n=1 Tax=Burkholderia sp. LMG 13014 TaxID=2709306 RepID=UPI001965879B|nr:SDR family oxidoreductase [Burkholderia sp. LMG 13014]